jgi:hypothetical protein
MNYPSFEEERKFLQDTYKEARLDPSHVTYNLDLFILNVR